MMVARWCTQQLPNFIQPLSPGSSHDFTHHPQKWHQTLNSQNFWRSFFFYSFVGGGTFPVSKGIPETKKSHFGSYLYNYVGIIF